jgi:hypothetical protein
MRRLLARLGARVARLDRRPVMHRVIVRAIPAAVRLVFDPGAATDLETTFELRVRDPRGREPTRFTIAVRECRCQVLPGPASDAVAAVIAGADDLVLMASGAVGWPELLSSGRLELTGNPFLALRFPVLFRLPPTSPPPAQTPRWARVPRTRRSSRSAATS